jgi:GTP-binding protein LepA
MSTKNTRNFCIIAHIDHGKSTLADRMLQLTHTVEAREMKNQFLDKLELERERGITIKLQAVRMQYEYTKEGTSNTYILNLIDTPGHIDFSYEVNRALAACEGAVLLVDASQGIQAQTLANYTKAFEANLKIIPVVNKIDLPSAHPEEVALDLVETFGFAQNEIIFVSGKTGEGVDELIESIIYHIPAPDDPAAEGLKALVFDSYYDAHKGVMAMVRVIEGTLSSNEPLYLMNSQEVFTPTEVGYITAHMLPVAAIQTGEVGYIATGLKNIQKVRVGDTITQNVGREKISPLPGYQEPKPMVFANIFPRDADDLSKLRDAIEKYHLTDAAFSYEPTNSSVLGAGFRSGFLGLLHLDVVQERLNQEYGVETQVTSPTVIYHVKMTNGENIIVKTPDEFPSPNEIEQTTEPWCRVQIFTQSIYIGGLMKISEEHRGEFLNLKYFGNELTDGQKQHSAQLGQRAELEYRMPLSEVISNFADKVKSVSAGYASLDYEVIEYRPVDLVKLEIFLNYEPYEALARLVVREKADEIGLKTVEKLKDILPQQQFRVPIQASIGSRVIARETLSALRKDVTAKLYGGDRTRKDKLLKKQAKGKKKMQEQGRMVVPNSVYQKIIGE